MSYQDIKCCICGKFLITEQRTDDNKIRCVKGSYDNCYYSDEDKFYCLDCAKLQGFEVK